MSAGIHDPTEGYPRDRAGVFALDFIKLLFRAQAAKQIGASGVCLIVEVALAEHHVDYLTPPNFWNGQLKDACGISDDHAFAALRRRCVEAGWLVHRKGPYASAAGCYWVTVPPGLNRAMGRRMIGVKPQTHPQTDPPTVPQTHPPTVPQTHPQTGPPTVPPTDPQSSTPCPSLSLPTPTHTHTGGEGDQQPREDGVGVGVGVNSKWTKQRDQRVVIERILIRMQVATGPQATNRWIAALKQNHGNVHSLDDVEACLLECIEQHRAAGHTVNYSSDVADRIRQWRRRRTP